MQDESAVFKVNKPTKTNKNQQKPTKNQQKPTKSLFGQHQIQVPLYTSCKESSTAHTLTPRAGVRTSRRKIQAPSTKVDNNSKGV